jgi:hypothetical protein
MHGALWSCQTKTFDSVNSVNNHSKACMHAAGMGHCGVAKPKCLILLTV